MSNRYLVSSSGMCLTTGVDYEFILLRSDMPDWNELAPALRKFVRLIREDSVYSNEWSNITMHEQKRDFASVDTIYEESEALIADFEEWSALHKVLKRAVSQDEYLKVYPQQRKKLHILEDRIFTHHRFFDHVFFFATWMFKGNEEDDTENIRADVEKLREAVELLPRKQELRGRDGGYGAQV